jgi:hypothetical protein
MSLLKRLSPMSRDNVLDRRRFELRLGTCALLSLKVFVPSFTLISELANFSLKKAMKRFLWLILGQKLIIFISYNCLNFLKLVL